MMAASDGAAQPIALRLEGLTVIYSLRDGSIPAVRDLSMSLHEGHSVALLGESGSGKSTTARAMAGLLTRNATARWDAFEVAGKQVGEGQMAVQTGRHATAYIFQDPRRSLNPLRTIGAHVHEAVRWGKSSASRKERRALGQEWLARAGLSVNMSVWRKYPHELSGGMRQRVAIALALAQRPRILVADEPTSSLDVSVQAGILGLLQEMMVSQPNLALVLITHDVAVARQLCERTLVMKQGKIVERGETSVILEAPTHPYTRELIAAARDIEGLGLGISDRPRAVSSEDVE